MMDELIAVPASPSSQQPSLFFFNQNAVTCTENNGRIMKASHQRVMAQSFKRGSYLENYLESVSSLPAELRRNLALMRDLDVRSQENLEAIDEEQKQYLIALRKAVKEGKEEPSEKTLQKIRADFQKCLEYSDEKVALAVQTYELVDKHIRRLDADLKKFEVELEAAGAPAPPGSPPTESASHHKKEKRKEKSEAVHVVTPMKKKSDMDPKDARVLNVDLDMPIDPNEPTYCICNRVSFGEMVGCDNPDCKIEWFHFECVGLTGPPKGKWVCADCQAQLRTKFRR